MDKKQLQRFLGSLNYLSDFIPDYSIIAKPLFNRLKKQPFLKIMKFVAFVASSPFLIWLASLSTQKRANDDMVYSYLMNLTQEMNCRVIFEPNKVFFQEITTGKMIGKGSALIIYELKPLKKSDLDFILNSLREGGGFILGC